MRSGVADNESCNDEDKAVGNGSKNAGSGCAKNDGGDCLDNGPAGGRARFD